MTFIGHASIIVKTNIPLTPHMSLTEAIVKGKV
jgi:hypothetical protein